MFFESERLSHALNLHLPTTPLRRALAAALLGAALSIFLPIRPAITMGRSMEPTLHNGQPFLFLDHKSSDQRYKRGDVLVFREKGLPTVKRVAAVGGQTLWIVPRTKSDPRPLWALAPGESVAAWKKRFPWVTLRRYNVPKGRLFVVGDGILSSDSREYGPIEVQAVMGRVAWPSIPEDPETWIFFHKLTPPPSKPGPVRIARR